MDNITHPVLTSILNLHANLVPTFRPRPVSVVPVVILSDTILSRPQHSQLEPRLAIRVCQITNRPTKGIAPLITVHLPCGLRALQKNAIQKHKDELPGNSNMLPRLQCNCLGN